MRIAPPRSQHTFEHALVQLARRRAIADAEKSFRTAAGNIFRCVQQKAPQLNRKAAPFPHARLRADGGGARRVDPGIASPREESFRLGLKSRSEK